MLQWRTLLAVASGAGLLAIAGMQAQQRTAKVTPLTPLDYIQIQQLVNHYSYALDTGADNGYMYADLFAPDGVMHSRVAGERDKRDYKGREEIAKLARIPAGGGGSRGPRKVSHFLTNHIIDATADGAVGKEYLVIVDLAENGKPGLVRQGGHYEDEYVKTPRGWRFKRREMIQSQSGPGPFDPNPPRPLGQ